MTNIPRVSVLLPVYNGMPHLLEVAESVLMQTFTDFEVLLVDDGSTDGSGEACDALAARDARVRVLRHEGGVNRGLVASLNLGLAEARSELIARVDADDISYPERFARQVAFLDAHPHVGVVGSRADAFDGETWSVWVEYLTHEMTLWQLLFTTPVMHSSVVMRREVPERIGGYDARYEYSEDYKFFYEASKVTQIVNLPEPLIVYKRDLASSISQTHANRQFVNYYAIQREVHRDYGLGHEVSATTSAFLSTRSFAETERATGPVGTREARAIVRSLHELRRVFVRRWAPSAETRRDIDDYVSWRASVLAIHLAERGLVSPLRARALRAAWDPRGVVRAAARRAARPFSGRT